MDEAPQTQQRLRAVALQYREATELPKVITSGADEIAAKIVELAKANGIPVKRDETLTDILAKVPMGAVIPEQAFRLVAEIVSFLYHCDKEWSTAKK